MKNKQILSDKEPADIEFDLNNIDYSVGISELSISFNKLAKKLLNKYESYLKSSQKKNKEAEDNETTTIEDKQNDSKLIELDELLASFDKIIEFVLTLKQQNSFVLLIIFQKTNLIVIQLIEFLNKLLNNFYQKNEFNNIHNHVSFQFDLNSEALESNGSIIGKTIQLLHVITSNKLFIKLIFFYIFYLLDQPQNNNDESTLYCCNLLTSSFNFTSPIANILLINGSLDQKPILNEQYSKACLDLMNNLTFNNRLFTVDVYIKKLIFFLIDRM